MKKIFKSLPALLALTLAFSSCTKDKNGTLGDATPPADLSIATTVVGKDATHPNGDGSGDVNIVVGANYGLNYRVDWDAADGLTFDGGSQLGNSLASSHKYTDVGTHTYTITLKVFGKNASSTTYTQNVTVQSDFAPDPELVSKFTNDGNKTWVVDQSVPGHLGVGPWGSNTAEWWNAGVNEKVACCNCFYTASFKFTLTNPTGGTLDVTAPNGAFTKTGDLAGGLPGVPATGEEGCYSGYTGGSSSFSFVPASGNIAGSTHTAIKLGGTNTYIGYGATGKTYEILSITENAIYLRVQGTEVANAWYLKLKAK